MANTKEAVKGTEVKYTIEVGDIIVFKSGNALQVQGNGRYINFDKEIWKKDAIKAAEEGRILARYPYKSAQFFS